MRLLLCLTLALAGLAGELQAAAPVNFKVLSLVDSSNEGPDRLRSYITMGPRRISFTAPPFCRLISATDSLTVTLDKPGQNGEFSVANSALRPDIDFIQQTETYFKTAESTLPKEAEEIDFKGSKSNVYFVNEWKSLSFDWSYTLFGKPVRRQVAFINLDPEHQICLTILSDEESEKPTFGTALRFMKSWYWADELNGTYK